ncbi:MAG: DUF4089 domain-containing protein [Janthinobacterium lividum]
MTPAQVEGYVDAAAAALGLNLDPAHRPGVLGYFALAAGFADIVEAVPLDMHVEPATVFVPVSPKERAE